MAIGDLNEATAGAVAEEMRQRFQVQAVATRMDVTASAAVAELAALAQATFGRIDIWVNNVDVYPPTVLTETTDAQWDEVQSINLRGTFFGCREAGKRMAAAGRGVIINITSVSGYRGRASIGHYTAAKHGVAGLTKSLAVELGGRRVRVVGSVAVYDKDPGIAGAAPVLSVR